VGVRVGHGGFAGPPTRAPGNERIKALEKMPRLVQFLEDAVETALAAIERAKKMAS